MKILNKFLSTATTLAMIASLATPVLAQDTNVELTGNGAFSDNTVSLESDQHSTVVQSNDANVHNNVTTHLNTGGNDASFNTGGDVTVWSGDIRSEIDVSNLLNRNIAENGCCDMGDMDVLISGNGAQSANDVTAVSGVHHTEIFQDNTANVGNSVHNQLETGDNESSYNTGGVTKIRTGQADAMVSLLNAANANIAFSENGGSGSGSDTSLRVLDNGAFSDTSINLDMEQQRTLVQSNDTSVWNNVATEIETGGNSATFSTAEDPVILTGNARSGMRFTNLLNTNSADIDCDCLLSDLSVTVDGNGAYSDNHLFNDMNRVTETFQDNSAFLDNVVRSDLNTGDNDADFGTGTHTTFIRSGNTDSWFESVNKANVNMSGDSSLNLPSVEWTWDMNWLHLGW